MMKKINFLLPLIICSCIPYSYAQDRTDDIPQVLIGNGIDNISGFGGLLMEFSSINGDFGVSTGGGGAVLLNQAFFFGGYGLNNHSNATYTNLLGIPGDANLDFRHGGLWAGYIFKPNKLFHYNISSKFGWGNIRLTDITAPGELIMNDNVFTVTPQAEGEINIAYWFRINASAGYRFTSGVNNRYYRTRDFSSPAFTLSFLFGWFKKYQLPHWWH